MKNALATILIALIFFNSCTEDKTQEKLKQEKANLQEQLDNKELLTYKSLKYLIRSADLTNSGDESTYTKILDADFGKLSLPETYRFVKAIIKARKAIENSAEDKYPTVLDQLIKLYDETGRSNVSKKYWNSSVEHMVIALMHKKIEQTNDNYALYEASLITADSLPKNTIFAIALLYKSTILTDFEYYYIAENDLNQLIEQIEKKQLDFTDNLEIAGTNLKIEKQKDYYLALSYFFRGMTRYHMQDEDKKSEAEKDLKMFSQIIDKLGLDDDLALVAGVYLNANNTEESLENLKKLQKSKLIDKDQKKMIKKLIKEVESGEQMLNPVTLLEVVNEKKIASHYLSNLILQSNFISQLKKSKSGKFIIQLPDNFEQSLKQYEKYKNAKNILNALWD